MASSGSDTVPSDRLTCFCGETACSAAACDAARGTAASRLPPLGRGSMRDALSCAVLVDPTEEWWCPIDECRFE